MATVVTLDVFSGRPNPTLQLSDAAETELTKRLGSLSNPTDQRPSGSIGGLGYRGFSIAKHDPTFVTQGHIHVHEAIIDREVGAANLVDDASIEKFLLDEFRAAIPPAVQDHVLASLSGAEGFLGGIERLKCPPCHAVDAPVYNPGAWNIPAVQPYNNCYNYANDHATNTFAQPGRAHGKQGDGDGLRACRAGRASRRAEPFGQFHSSISQGSGLVCGARHLAGSGLPLVSARPRRLLVAQAGLHGCAQCGQCGSRDRRSAQLQSRSLHCVL